MLNLMGGFAHIKILQYGNIKYSSGELGYTQKLQSLVQICLSYSQAAAEHQAILSLPRKCQHNM